MADDATTTTQTEITSLAHTIARNVRRLRQMHGYTQGELAERAGTSRDTVHSVEVARQPGLRLRTLERLAGGLGENVVTLLWPCSIVTHQRRGRPRKHHRMHGIGVAE